MATPILSDRDHSGVARILNLPNAASPQEPATKAQLDSAIEGLAWKDSARVATQGNINLASPGASIDGVTLTIGDRVLVRSQTAAAENGIYVWNGAASAMARAPDANTADELEAATLTVEEGTSAGATFRQTAVNFTLGSGAVTWTSFGTSAPAASTSTAGVIRIATQAEVNAKTGGLALTPETAAGASWMLRKFAQTIGDGSATQFTITHNFGTQDVGVTVFRTSDGVEVIADVTRSAGGNAVVIGFSAAPTTNQYRVVVLG